MCVMSSGVESIKLVDRISQHFGGDGAAWTQRPRPIAVNHIQRCRSLTTARMAERIVYRRLRNYHGRNLVRGAGFTRAN